MDFNKIKKIKYNLSNRYLLNPQKNISPHKLELYDKVVVYNNGKSWIVVALDFFLKVPIIKDIFYDEKKAIGEKKIITIFFCPFSGTLISYLGNYVISKFAYNNFLLLENVDNPDEIILPINNTSFSISNRSIENKFNVIHEVKIMLLRNCLSKFPDCKYIEPTTTYRYILPKTYYSSKKIHLKIDNHSYKFHPKTKIFAIVYKNNKNVIVVSNDASKRNVNNYNIQHNGIEPFFDKNIRKIRDRGGIIIPCLWFSFYDLFSKSKIVEL